MQIPYILQLSPTGFIAFLDSQSIEACHFVLDESNGTLKASHAVLQPIADYYSKLDASNGDFDKHEGLFLQIGPVSRVLQGAFLHRTKRGPGAGGVRNHPYDTMDEYFRDGMRLAKGMSHKNALAGLAWGGGKGVMARNSGTGLNYNDPPAARHLAYKEYGSFLTNLRGCYVTAEDVGTSVLDMTAIYSATRYTTCIPWELGGSGNPSIPTAHGVAAGMEAAFAFLGRSLRGISVAVMGVGHVGEPLCKILFEKGVSRIIASDVDARRRTHLEQEFKNYNFQLRIVEDKRELSILFEDVDCVAPCAVGGILSPETISRIKARVVCGAANNQLLHLNRDDKLLAKHGILYMPDFLVNRMGIVNCADEHMGALGEDDPKLALHLGKIWDNSIYNLTMTILRQSVNSNRTPQEIAVEMAEARSHEINPVYGHRAWQVIKLIATRGEWMDRVKMH